jgi:hypothetical protein
VTPRRLAGAALVIAAAYTVAHVAGLGAFVTALSGSLPPGGVSPAAGEAACVIYLALYAAVTLIAPILLLAAAILAGLLRWGQRCGAGGSAAVRTIHAAPAARSASG